MMGRRPGITFEQRERAIDMLTAGMSARDVDRHFQRHESAISRLLNRFQQTGNVADRPRSGRPRKTTPREDRFLTTSSRRNTCLSSRKLGRLLRNATGTRVCYRTVRGRLHAARLKACCSYVGIPLTLRHREKKKKKRQWARVHQDWTRRQWRNVLSSTNPGLTCHLLMAGFELGDVFDFMISKLPFHSFL